MLRLYACAAVVLGLRRRHQELRELPEVQAAHSTMDNYELGHDHRHQSASSDRLGRSVRGRH